MMCVQCRGSANIKHSHQLSGSYDKDSYWYISEAVTLLGTWKSLFHLQHKRMYKCIESDDFVP